MIYEYVPEWILQWIYAHWGLWCVGAFASVVALSAVQSADDQDEEDM